ncbi:MAG: nucleotide exchange factor GrpE [Syntrophobacterales bacterium]|nr:MAG: nucleotide exchange factor GrpE [Syntrophobacterales bacterium]
MTKTKETRDSGVAPLTEAQGEEKQSRNRKSKRKQEIEMLKAQVEEKTKLGEENYDRFLRAQAELENYKKRVEREKSSLVKYGNEDLIKAILPVIDNLERALDHPQGENPDGVIEGIKITLNQLLQVLEKFGVTRIQAMGEPFDPSKHEAMMQVESADHEPNTVVSELQKGYLLNDRLLRPAMVSVAQPPKKKEEGEGSS